MDTARFKAQLVRIGKRQWDVVAVTGISPSRLSNIVNNRVSARDWEAVKIAKAVKLQVGELFSNSESDKRRAV